VRERVLLSSQTRKKETNAKEKSERDEHFLWCETNNEREKRIKRDKKRKFRSRVFTHHKKESLSFTPKEGDTKTKQRVKIKNVVIVIDTTDESDDDCESTNANETKKTKRESNHFESFFFFFVFFFAF